MGSLTTILAKCNFTIGEIINASFIKIQFVVIQIIYKSVKKDI
jgi:hypothetical protein